MQAGRMKLRQSEEKGRRIRMKKEGRKCEAGGEARWTDERREEKK